jgi:hypothetical protein
MSEIGNLHIHFGKTTVYDADDEDDENKFYIKAIFGVNSQKTKSISSADELNFDEG